MAWIVRIVAILIALVVVTACTAGGAGISLARSQKARAENPQVPEADAAALAAGNSAFALDLYQQLDGESNLFFSPYSISSALAMTFAGAKGDTQAAMARVLHFDLPASQLHPAFNHLGQRLASRAESGGQGADGKGFRLNIVNDLWGQRDHEFLPAFLDLLAENYGAGVRLVDFVEDPQAARATINRYIEEQTEQRIKDLLPPDAVTPDTRLVLTNAVYFNAAWLEPFDVEATQSEPFHNLDGSVSDVMMMQRSGMEQLEYAQGAGWQAAALPYENPSLVMWLVVPDAGNYDVFNSSLTAETLQTMLSESQSRSVFLRMPRWEMQGSYGLSAALQALGMQPAFDPDQADFSGIDGTRNLSISDVVHKSFIKVDEAGTEAAAATAVLMGVTSMPIETEAVELTIDRPFLYFIYDRPTRTILFFGAITKLDG